MLKFQVKNDNIGVVVNKFLVETGKDWISLTFLGLDQPCKKTTNSDI